MHRAITEERIRSALHTTRLLVGGYLGLSVLTLVAIVLLRNDTSMVNQAVWVRVCIVTASAWLSFLAATRAARGVPRAYLRLRIITAATVVAIAAIIAIPDPFPLWLKVEQGVCGVVLLAVVVIVNSRHVRSLFAALQADAG